MTHLIGISGSLRQGSYNTALLRAAFEDLPDGVTAEIANLDGLPMYDWDEERNEGIPAAVAELRARVGAADGIVFATPEYNYSVTGALKNAIDWLSRGPSSPIDFKRAAIIGAGGGGGTLRSQEHLREMLAHNRLHVLAEPQVMVPGARMRFADGELADDAVRTELRLMIDGMVDLIEREAGAERPDVRGSVLVVAPDAASTDALARHVAEGSYRTVAALTATDAERLMLNRAVAAAVVDVAHPDRFAIIERLAKHHPQAPVVVADDPGFVGDQLDTALRLELAGR